MVVGARSMAVRLRFGRALGNRVYNWFALLCRQIYDPGPDLRLQGRQGDMARSFLYLLPNTYSYPTTITLGVLRSGRTLKYVPIECPRPEKGKARSSCSRTGFGFS